MYPTFHFEFSALLYNYITYALQLKYIVKKLQLMYEKTPYREFLSFLYKRRRVYRYRALHTFFEKVAAVRVYTVYVARRVIGIRGTTARAIQPCPAIGTFGFGIDIAAFEFVAHGGICYAVKHITHEIIFISDKLMTRI